MKKLANHDVFNEKEKVLNVSIYKDGAWISDYANTWKLFFRNGTYECGLLSYLVEKKDDVAIMTLARTMYYSRLAFKSIAMVNAIHTAADNYATIKDTLPNDNDDAKILAEEKVMHEQTLDAIDELEKNKRRWEVI